MSKIKYLGTADVAVLEKGENFAGRLRDPLAQRVEWNVENGHVVDTDEVGLSDTAVELLLEDKDRFKDVTDLKRIPSSLNEQIFRGHSATKVADGEDDDDEVDEDTTGTAPAKATAATKSGARTGASATGAAATAGGSTAGTTAPVGGSTATS